MRLCPKVQPSTQLGVIRERSDSNCNSLTQQATIGVKGIELVEQNFMDDIRNLICKISFFKSIIGQNYSNVNSQISRKGGKLIVNNSKD